MDPATRRKERAPKAKIEANGVVEFELFIYKDADKVLDEKGLLQEIKDSLKSVKKVDYREIQAAFSQRRWMIEKQIFPEATWAWDVYKDKVAVSVELSLIDAVHRDFLRAILANKHGHLDVLVNVTSAFKEPKFHNVKRDLQIFHDILTFPILLVGLKEVGDADPNLQRFLREVLHAREKPKKTLRPKKIPKEAAYV